MKIKYKSFRIKVDKKGSSHIYIYVEIFRKSIQFGLYSSSHKINKEGS